MPFFHYAFPISDIAAVSQFYVGKTGEQATLFFLYPDGNALEFKAFVRPAEVFVSQP